MKNKKFKLFASLTSLVMVVAVMAVGVWAATGAELTVKGTASFATTGIAATIVGSTEDAVTGVGSHTAALDNTIDANKFTDNLVFTIDAGDDGVIDAQDDNTWVITYTITNTGSTTIAVSEGTKVDATAHANGAKITATVTVNDATIGTEQGNNTGTVTVEYALTVPASNAGTGFDLTNSNIDQIKIILSAN